MAIAREERGTHAVLVIDHNRSMANAHRDLLTEAGAVCRIASGAESGWQALEDDGADVIVLALSLPQQGASRFLQRLVNELHDTRPLVIGTRFQEEKPTPELAVDAVVVKPCPPEALLHATGVRPRQAAAMDPLACAAALLTTSALGRAGRESMLDMIADVREAFAADACIVWRAQTQETWTDGGRELSPEELARAAHLAAAAASEQTTIVTQALLVDATEDYENAFESHHAVVGGHEGATLTVSLVHRGFVRLSARERQLLDGFVRRIAHELSWQNAQERLVAELDAMRDVGGLDPMLGIWSRSTLRRLLEMLESWCRRLGEPLSLAVVDICGMGRINDAHGHHEGDALLKHVAEVAVYVVRGYDVVARYGGDEIAIVFGGARVEDAVRVVERLQSALTSQPYQTDAGIELQLKLGAGVTVLGGPDDSGDKALARAAGAASRAAAEGRTVVATHQRARRTGDEQTPISLERPLEGVTLGGTYRILHEIGSGGGGGVYRGEDLGLRRPVAVKVLRPDFARDEELVERFRDEAAILASLRHNHLVQVYAFGVEDGIAFFVMELVEGESLHDAVARSIRESTQIPVTKIATVVRQIGSALETLHRSGVIHRDVKPANILLDPFRGRSVLVDVGIAIRPGEKAPFAGTPGYVAPEAVESLKLEGSSDVYGLAVTIYELLTLKLPWPHSDNVLSMLRAQREKTPTPPSTHRPELAPVDDILLRALAVDPSKRWPDVNGFATALVDALAVVVAAPISAREATEISGPDSSPDSVKNIGAAPTLSWTPAVEGQRASTRGVVFRSIPRVLGPRNAVAWRVQLKAQAQHLAEALSPSAPPLGWLPTEWLIELLRGGPPGVRDPLELGRDLGRAAVRATFRRFFPMSTATLTPNGTLHALPQIWPHYHSWGRLHVVNATRDSAQVRILGTPGADVICAWVRGMLEQLLILSGADAVNVDHPLCESTGADACRFDARWTWVPRSDRSWR